MGCTDWAERISALIDEELTPEERGAVEQHLAACAECAKAADGLRRVSRLARALPRVTAPAGLAEAVRAAVAPARQIPFLARYRTAIQSAAALVAVALVVYAFYSPSNVIHEKTAPPELANRPAPSDSDMEKSRLALAGKKAEHDLAAQADTNTLALRDAAPAGSGGGVVKPAPPAEEADEKKAKEQSKDHQELAKGPGDSVTPAPQPAAPGAGAPAPPAAPGQKLPQDPSRENAQRDKEREGLTTDLLAQAQEVRMRCADAGDAQAKVTRLLNDLRVSFTITKNHTTHVAIEVPADRADEVIAALDKLEPSRFGFYPPDRADDAEGKADGFAKAGEGASSGRAPAEPHRATDGRLSASLLEESYRRAGKSAKALGVRAEDRKAAMPLRLVISLDPTSSATPPAGEAK